MKKVILFICLIILLVVGVGRSYVDVTPVSNMNFDNRILLEDISIPKDISVLSDPKALVAIITN